MNLKLFFITLGFVIVVTSITAKEIVRIKEVDFGKGNQTISVIGIIKGHNSTHYKVKVKSNDTLSVQLADDNVYFNIYEPNKGKLDGALFTGKIEGKSFVGTLSKDGTYTIKVYLLDSEASTDNKILYTLDIGLK